MNRRNFLTTAAGFPAIVRARSGAAEDRPNVIWILGDDLGTELANSFTTSELFNIINTRLLERKKTIISTNLKPEELVETYTQRVFSRISAHYRALKFYGHDLRM